MISNSTAISCNQFENLKNETTETQKTANETIKNQVVEDQVIDNKQEFRNKQELEKVQKKEKNQIIGKELAVEQKATNKGMLEIKKNKNDIKAETLQEEILNENFSFSFDGGGGSSTSSDGGVGSSTDTAQLFEDSFKVNFLKSKLTADQQKPENNSKNIKQAKNKNIIKASEIPAESNFCKELEEIELEKIKKSIRIGVRRRNSIAVTTILDPTTENATPLPDKP